MSKNNRHLQLIRSSELNGDGTPKLPSSGDVMYGELAINFSKGKETLSTINSENEIITFPNNGDITNIKNDINTISGTVEEEIDDLLILTSAITRMNESLGFTENIKYAPKSTLLKDLKKVTPAIDYLATKIVDLEKRIQELEKNKT